MPSYTIKISDSQKHERFLALKKITHKVIFFSSKETIAPVYRMMTAKFRRRILVSRRREVCVILIKVIF